MKKVEFVFLVLDGKSEIMEFINGLPVKDRSKLYDTINIISEFGIPIAARQEWVKKLDSDIYEIRSKVGTNIQRCLYFHKYKNIYVITNGFTKKTDRTPQREIRRARLLMNRSKSQDDKS
ncbi:type II toxin-antitoxin system RelE/ParE family toxin [Companilactobacillus allii]|uniref:Addiction module toxin RelE n=1 Tax=Companilactobacillus allii TaxID=1847728 RepID=A0A1P8Q227_9LACO|nr:type II toxin-antitoxin system RelE/ParE family toxin [Companilactobacillus allii]APX71839.1 addiction module toxin RelE [Companilactobacillus allii]USQ68926.1 type II toxin-antitoxin system RelE/ParE family toxin [Companilactobacillus allii]